jgi:hypothetical protein
MDERECQTEDMDEKEEARDERSRRVKAHAYGLGAQAFLANYPKTLGRDLAQLHAQGVRVAGEVLLAHPDYLDEARTYYDWFASCWCEGYVDQEERVARQIASQRGKARPQDQ